MKQAFNQYAVIEFWVERVALLLLMVGSDFLNTVGETVLLEMSITTIILSMAGYGLGSIRQRLFWLERFGALLMCFRRSYSFAVTLCTVTTAIHALLLGLPIIFSERDCIVERNQENSEEDNAEEEEEAGDDRKYTEEGYRELDKELEQMAALHGKEILRYEDELNKRSMDHLKERAVWEAEKQQLLKLITELEALTDECSCGDSCFRETSRRSAYLGAMRQVVEEEAQKLKVVRRRRTGLPREGTARCLREVKELSRSVRCSICSPEVP